MLLKWWTEQNVQHRNLWPGIASQKVGEKWPAEEILNQIRITRGVSGASGNIHWSMKCLAENHGGLATALVKGVYAKTHLNTRIPLAGFQSPQACPN